MTQFNLRQARLRSGEELEEDVDVELEPLTLGGQEYVPDPPTVRAQLRIHKASTGTVYELAFRAGLRGPCFRCLRDTRIEESVHAREYQATNAGLAAPKAARGTDPELQSEYVHDDVLELSDWARDAFALQLPDKILHAPDCAGLCPVCGDDLNDNPHTHDELGGDPRWAALDELRGQL